MKLATKEYENPLSVNRNSIEEPAAAAERLARFAIIIHRYERRARIQVCS
jgi:hypothetical protein